MESAVQIIQALGFPIFVCLWLMYRQDKKSDLIYEAHKRTNVVLAVLVKVLTSDNGVAVPSHIVDEVSGVVDPQEDD